MSVTLQTVAVVVAGLMVGNEFCVSAFIHPRLRALDDRAHAAAAQAIARALGAAMPPWYAATLILSAVVAYGLRHSGPVPFRLGCASAALWLVSIVYSIAWEVPINTQVAGWDLEHLPDDWKQIRLRWDTLHAVRVVILTVALVCLVVACLMSQG